MGDVIEHVPDPIRFVEAAAAALRPRGYLLVVTPNIDSWVARLTQVKPREHLLYFNGAKLNESRRP